MVLTDGVDATTNAHHNSKQVNVRGFVLFHLGKAVRLTYYRLYPSLRNPMLPEVIRVIHSFDPPVATSLLLSASCHETFQIRYALMRGWSAWLGNNGQSSPDVRSGSLRLHRHKRCSPLDHDSRPKSFRHSQRCPYTVREASACFVSSDGWYDALFSHLFWHVLDRRVALIFWLFIIIFSSYIRARRTFIRGILISFYGFSQAQSQNSTSQHTATTAGLSSMCLWPALSVLYSSPQLDPLYISA
jgi:hypothetical protein